MVQRKDSLNYVEFLRGKYDPQDKAYIMNLFSNMTPKERSDAASLPFDSLWQELWKIKTCSVFQREYTESKHKFNALKTGYDILSTHEKLDISFVVRNTRCMINEAEYGFPKGRRNMNEMDIHCAIREFVEETGVQDSQFKLMHNVKPFEETFVGSNKVRYRHVYYIAKCKDSGSDNIALTSNNKLQTLEVQTVKWMTYEEAQAKILHQNRERKEMFRRLNNFVRSTDR